jgi:hypothetical protein
MRKGYAGLGSPKATERSELEVARAEGIALKIIPPKTKSITQVTTQQKLIVSQKNAIGIRRAWFAKGNRASKGPE